MFSLAYSYIIPHICVTDEEILWRALLDPFQFKNLDLDPLLELKLDETTYPLAPAVEHGKVFPLD